MLALNMVMVYHSGVSESLNVTTNVLLVSWLPWSIKRVGPNLHVTGLNVFLFDSCLITNLFRHFLPFLGIQVRTAREVIKRKTIMTHT